MTFAIVIFGAAVRLDGSPSPSLQRRIRFGLSTARLDLNAPVFCSGGKTGEGPSEAAVMARILTEGGVTPDRIVLDEQSRDTLQNVMAASRFILEQGLEGAVVCTDSYHAPRVRMLFRGLGVRSEGGPIDHGRGPTSWAYWTFMSAREIAAYAYDFMIIRLRRRELGEMISNRSRD